MAVDYRKKLKLGFEIYPSATISNCVANSFIVSLAIHCKVECENASGGDSVCYFLLVYFVDWLFATDSLILMEKKINWWQ